MRLTASIIKSEGCLIITIKKRIDRMSLSELTDIERVTRMGGEIYNARSSKSMKQWIADAVERLEKEPHYLTAPNSFNNPNNLINH